MGTVGSAADIYQDPIVGLLAVCYPEGARLEQLANVTAKWLDEHPERLHEGARDLIWESHSEAFGLQLNEQCWRHEDWASWNP